MQPLASSSSDYTFLRRVEDIEHILRERVALLPGARDRSNRPLIFVPARDVATHPDHLRNLLIYLYDVTAEDAKARGFTFVIDMHKGTSWEIVKPILKFLQEYFPAAINCVYIIKPDKFLEKYKISTAKYNKFELQMISFEALPKFIDFCQILREFGGSLRYDHDEWIELRREIEKIVFRISEILKSLDRIALEMVGAGMPVDVTTAQSAIQKHQSLHSIITAVPLEEFEAEIQSLRERVLASGAQQSLAQRGGGHQLQNGSLATFSNPDLIAVFPHLFHLLKSLVRTRNEVICQWESRKTELDQCSQLKLFEKDAENLSQWIYKHFNSLTHRFVLIGENELETTRLLKEHLDFADSVNKIEVSYSQVVTVGKRLLELQTLGMNKIENISQQLKSDWTQFMARIEQRTALLKLALNAHIKCNSFLQNVGHWMTNVGVDPQSIRSNMDLSEAAHQHQEFQKVFQTGYSEAFEEANQLSRTLKKYFGDSVNQLPIYKLIQEQIQQIIRTNREIHGIWEARNITIQNRISSAVFISDLKSVLDWLTQHGEPFLRRKIGIGMDHESSAALCKNHHNFRMVAINTHKNAEQIFQMTHVLEDADGRVRAEALGQVEELRLRIDKFRRCIEHRTHLLYLASNFFLHYEEIMAWYVRMDSRTEQIRVVPDTVEQCERNKEKLQSENDGTVQAYDRVMIEAQQLLQSLKQQRELLDMDNTESVILVQNLMKNIENKHLSEKERWQEQRTYLNTALKISTFLRDCYEIKKQLESWRQDLQGLRHSVSNTVEIIKQYHTQNTIKVQQVVNDAMKQLSEIIQLIQSKELHMATFAEPNKTAEEVIVFAANELQGLEQDVMNIAKDVSNRIELNIQLNRLRQMAHEVIGSIERERMRLRQLYHIPGNQQEAELQLKYFDEFRFEIEVFEDNITRFYNEKDRFTDMPILALDSHAETRVRAENLLTEVKAKWQCLIGLMEARFKLLTAASSYYKYTKLLLPTSQSIENDLSVDKSLDFCRTGSWNSLETCYKAIQDRLEKHANHKERFLEASVYAQRTADLFMRRLMHKCEAPKEHIEMRLIEVQQYKDTVRERQAIILRLWTECNAQIEQCRIFVRIQLLAKEVIDWSDREMATCAQILNRVQQIGFNSSPDQSLKLGEQLERCLELKDLVKVERNEVRIVLKEAKLLENSTNEFHSVEADKIAQIAKSRIQNIWSLLAECEQTIKEALSADQSKVLRRKSEQPEQLCLDRYSDSTIEDRIGNVGMDGRGAMGEGNRMIFEPMKELLKSERDYIEDLRKCVEIYLHAYQTSGSMCPMAIRGKEREIFGNIEELFQFHSSIFLDELIAYERNPEDVGYCFIAWMEKLKELYADYCLNKEEHNYLICLPEAIKMFTQIREQNNMDPCHDLQSLVIKPVQRITKYHILLKELLKYSVKNTKEISNAYEIVVSIPKLANDRMHLKSFENYQDYSIGDFVMQDTFLVSEPKRYFKRERELQIFLFESNIVFAKREELACKRTGYVYKESMLLREIHVVEHVEGDNTKFGLRRSAVPYQNDQNTTVLKANTEAQRILWVKVLRDLKLDIGRQKSSISDEKQFPANNRGSQSSITLPTSSTVDDRHSIQSGDSNNSGGKCTWRYESGVNFNAQEKQQYVVTEPFVAIRGDQISVEMGQRVEIVQQQQNCSDEDFVRVALLDGSSKRRQQRQVGTVPRSILIPVYSEHDAPGTSSQLHDEVATPANTKRTSIRRFFAQNQKVDSTGKLKQQQQQVVAIDQSQPSCSTASAGGVPLPEELHPQPDQPNPPTSVLSVAVCPPSSATALRQQANNNDQDLPPPMDQILGGNTSTPPATDGDEPEDQSTQMNIDVVASPGEEQPSSSVQQNATATTPLEQMSAQESARLKRGYVLQELVETERAYVIDLNSIVDGYIGSLREMELSGEEREKVKIIFANIEQILNFHKTIFLNEIEKSTQDYEAAGNAFIKYERRLHTYYVKYCQNKPKSDFLVSQDYFEQLFTDVKDKLGHKVALCDLLIKPVQRITKYQLMLSDITKYTLRSGDKSDVLERAHNVMRIVPKACDDMMQVGRLQGFQGNLNAQGRLIYQGTLLISDGAPSQPFKGKERRVFLFEQSVIIAECIPPRKEYGNPTYNFKNQIMVNKMLLEQHLPDEPLRFLLQSNDPSQQATYVAQAASAEDKEQWLDKLSAQLDQQKTFLAALVDPKRYQNQLANSIGSMNIGGKKDSSDSLGTPTSPAAPSLGGTSPTKQTAPVQKSSSSKLFGFGKQKS